MWEAPDKFLSIMKECFSARSWKNYSTFFKFVKCVVNLIENFHYLKETYNLWLTYWPIVTYSKMDLLTGYAEAVALWHDFGLEKQSKPPLQANKTRGLSSFAEAILGLVQFNYFLSFGGTRIAPLWIRKVVNLWLQIQLPYIVATLPYTATLCFIFLLQVSTSILIVHNPFLSWIYSILA